MQDRGFRLKGIIYRRALGVVFLLGVALFPGPLFAMNAVDYCQTLYLSDGWACLAVSGAKTASFSLSASCTSLGQGDSVSSTIICDNKPHQVAQSQPESIGDGVALRFNISRKLFANAQNLTLALKINHCTLAIAPVLKNGIWTLPNSLNKTAWECKGSATKFTPIQRYS